MASHCLHLYILARLAVLEELFLVFPWLRVSPSTVFPWLAVSLFNISISSFILFIASSFSSITTFIASFSALSTANCVAWCVCGTLRPSWPCHSGVYSSLLFVAWSWLNNLHTVFYCIRPVEQCTNCYILLSIAFISNMLQMLSVTWCPSSTANIPECAVKICSTVITCVVCLHVHAMWRAWTVLHRSTSYIYHGVHVQVNN